MTNARLKAIVVITKAQSSIPKGTIVKVYGKSDYNGITYKHMFEETDSMLTYGASKSCYRLATEKEKRYRLKIIRKTGNSNNINIKNMK
jgi:hypothetical protein